MERIPVPSSAIGHIIGKGGANIKDIQNRSGAKCRVVGNNVEVTGSSGARRLAINLIQDCVDNSIVVYNHPVKAIIALRPPLVGLKSVKFISHQGITEVSNVNKAFFVLDKGEEADEDDDISSLLGSLSIKETTLEDIVAPEGDKILVAHIAKLLAESKDELKVRANIGKQLFYPAKKGERYLPTSVPLDRLLKYKIGTNADIKSSFANTLTVDMIKAIEDCIEKLGYEGKDGDEKTIQRASIHVIDVNKKEERVTVAIDITPEGLLEFRKCKIDNTNHLLLSFAKSKSTPDFRFKILSHKASITTIPSELRRIIDNATYDPKTKTIKLPDSKEYRVSTIRVKTKRRFVKSQGSDNVEYKLSISDVYEKGGKSSQVTVTNPGLGEILAKMKNAETSTGKKNEKELEEELEKKLEQFANEMNAITDKIQWAG